MEMQTLMNCPGVEKVVTAIPGVPAKFYPEWNKLLIVLCPWILPKVIQECSERRGDGWGSGGPEAELMSQNLCLQQERWFSVSQSFLISVFKSARNPPLKGQNGGLAEKRAASATPFFKINFYWNMLIYNIMLISAVQQNESVIHASTLTSQSITEFLVLHSGFLLVIYYIYRLVYTSVPIS